MSTIPGITIIRTGGHFPGAMVLHRAGDPQALRNKTLTLFWDNLGYDSWLAGSRKVNCSIGKQVEGGGFASITGSAKGDILIDGQPPVAPEPLPEGRSLPSPLPGAVPLPGQ